MRIAVLGGDGYCGWATALYLSEKGHSVAIVDNFVRRQWDHELGVTDTHAHPPLADRLSIWNELTGKSSTPSLAISPTTISSHPSCATSSRMRWCISRSSAPRRIR